MNEQTIIDQLSQYRQIVARIKLLSEYSVGNGITVSRLNADDQLQDLHRRLRGLPSYMYLGKREQRLETVAHAYLTAYPAGTRAQLAELPYRGADDEDTKLLRELRGKIEKVIEARAGSADYCDDVIERISELQDLTRQRDQIDRTLDALEEYKPDYARVLRLRYCEGRKWADIGVKLSITRSTCDRWHKEAITKLTKLLL